MSNLGHRHIIQGDVSRGAKICGGPHQIIVVVVNPPYFAKDPVHDAERAWFAGADLGYFERFFAGLGDHLALGRPSALQPSSCLMVLGEGCDMVTISAAAARHGFVLRLVASKMIWLGVQLVWSIERDSPA